MGQQCRREPRCILGEQFRNGAKIECTPQAVSEGGVIRPASIGQPRVVAGDGVSEQLPDSGKGVPCIPRTRRGMIDANRTPAQAALELLPALPRVVEQPKDSPTISGSENICKTLGLLGDATQMFLKGLPLLFRLSLTAMRIQLYHG
jgi:hypothetical protein